MINKESILSAFTDRATLLLWLKKVEAALKNAVLSDVSVNQISDTEIRLEFKFEDGNSTLSPVLTLPRGPQGVAGPAGATGPQGPAGPEGPQGEPGRDGLDGEGIAATIEVGTVTTGAAGTDASVTNAGTEQRAILNFVIPRGNDGAPGPAGTDGVGFGDATGSTILSSPVLSSEQNGIKLTGNIIIEAGEETFEIPSSMVLPLTGNESIVVDIAEDGRSINIHLDADVLAKMNRALVTPMSAPASISLVAVNTANAQEMLTLGAGLSVSGGVISATGGSSGDGALFHHEITCAAGTLHLLTKSSVVYTDLASLFAHIVFGAWLDEGGAYARPVFIYLESTEMITTRAYTISNTGTMIALTLGSFSADKVTPV